MTAGDTGGTQDPAMTSPGCSGEGLQSHHPNWALRVKQGLSWGGGGRKRDSSLYKAPRHEKVQRCSRDSKGLLELEPGGAWEGAGRGGQGSSWGQRRS